MAKKRLILTQKQLDEIRDGIGTYLDTIGIKSDMPDNFGNEITADGSTFDGYADNTTTDDFAKMQSKDWPRDSRSYGRSGNAPANIREMSKKEWEEAYILNEESEHGNAELNNRVFGDSNKQYSYSAIKQKEYRERKAARKAINGSSEAEKLQGLKSLQKIQNNDRESYDKAKKQFEPAKQATHLTKKGIKSAPKQTGNGKSHSTKNGIITPIQ